MIELKNISFSYANNCEDSQLRHIDLTVKKGELIILAGKSGCGKTTLTRVLNGLCPQFYPGNLTGSYSLDGQDALKIPIHQLGTMVGSVFQDPRSQFFTTNTTDEIALGMENIPLARTVMRERIETVCAQMNIDRLLDRRIFPLSSGEKQLIEHAEIIDRDGKDIVLKNADIEFQNVTFSYDKTPVLRNISFSIPQGSTTAIVGPSGSGKTTICNLIARFYDVDSGKVLVGGENVRDMTCDSLLRNISMVFQKVYLFHDTIENNIRFGNPNASQEEVIAAAKKARCHDFIMSLPEGYQTVIGEGGSTLSGGEKQRVSIARAILKNANIVILDEATASIDPENEHLIQQAISELTIGKTVIVIAHRLATIEHADQILVVDDGRIVQKGTHNQLIRQEGIYKRFINIREQAEGWSIA